MSTTLQVIGLALTLFMAWLCSHLADRKNRNPAGWAALGILFWPVALPVIGLLPPATAEPSAAGLSQRQAEQRLAIVTVVVAVLGVAAVALILAS